MGADSMFRLRQAFCLLILLSVVMIPFRAGGQVTVTPGTIRVCLVRDAQAQDFYVRGKYRLVGINGEFLAQVLPGERWQARFSGAGLQMYRNGQLVGNYGTRVALQQARPTVAVLGGSGALKNVIIDNKLTVMGAGGQVSSLRPVAGGINVVSGSGTSVVQGGGDLFLVALVIGGRAKNYRGEIEFRAQDAGITAINELPLEEYLYGVVPREMPASWPMEALKAQAVCARSYALAQLGTYRAYGFDLLSTQMSQVYGGYDGEHPNSSRAVDETRGKVLYFRDRPIAAFFHSSSGGYIEYCQDVWKEALEYLKAKPDPYDKNDKHYNWVENFNQEKLVNQLKEKKSLYNKPNEQERAFSRVDDIEVLEKTSSGVRVKKVGISGLDSGGKPLRVELSNADVVRSAFGLKSAMFEIKKEKDAQGKLTAVTIEGSGYGHGLGMSQYGAYGMAGQGYNYQDILKYYYYNVEIRTLS